MFEIFAGMMRPHTASGIILYLAFPLLAILFLYRKKRGKLTAKNEEGLRKYFLSVLAITILLFILYLIFMSDLSKPT